MPYLTDYTHSIHNLRLSYDADRPPSTSRSNYTKHTSYTRYTHNFALLYYIHVLVSRLLTILPSLPTLPTLNSLTTHTLLILALSILMPASMALGTPKNNTKILIITPTSNHPEYIKLQDISFKKYLQDAYEFIVFNDATDDKTKQEIENTCAELNIACIRVPQENRPIGTLVSWASYRHGQALNYIMQTEVADYSGIVALIDSDMFLIKEFSVATYLKGYDIAGLNRGPDNNKMAYIWPGLLFFRMNNLPNKKTINFMPEDSLHYDTGGSLCHYFTANPLVKTRLFSLGRIKLNKNMFPYHLYSSPCRASFARCASCNDKISKKKNQIQSKCVHKRSIYKQLQFRDSIVDLILSYKIPYAAEFILGDTFFHISGSSGYYKWPETDVKNREVCMNNFIGNMLGL